MLIDRLRHHASRFSSHTEDAEAHRAAVDLLVLTLFCNGSVSQAELEQLSKFDVEHSDWDEADFSVGQYVPVAMAKVRTGLEESGQDALLAQFAGRVTEPALRAETVAGCEAMARIDGLDDVESAFLAKVREALAN